MGSDVLGEGDSMDSLSLLSMIREDLVANRGRWMRAGFHAIAVYRLGVWALSKKGGLSRSVANLAYRMLQAFVQNVYSIELPRTAKIGRRLQIPHPAGIVISNMAEIGDDCLIRQNVTIGQFNRGRTRTPPYAPQLGNGVEVGAGAVIVGGIKIGDHARIGPNAVVMTDVPPGAAAFAGTAKIMEPLKRGDAKMVDPAPPKVVDR